MDRLLGKYEVTVKVILQRLSHLRASKFYAVNLSNYIILLFINHLLTFPALSAVQNWNLQKNKDKIKFIRKLLSFQVKDFYTNFCKFLMRFESQIDLRDSVFFVRNSFF